MRSLMIAAIVLAAMLNFTGDAEAGFIAYTESVVGSGSFGGTSYTNALITLSVTRDTYTIIYIGYGQYFTGFTTTTVSVAGIKSGTFVGAAASFQLVPGFSFVAQGDNYDILTPVSSAAATYNLSTPIGPITGTMT